MDNNIKSIKSIQEDTEFSKILSKFEEELNKFEDSKHILSNKVDLLMGSELSNGGLKESDIESEPISVIDKLYTGLERLRALNIKFENELNRMGNII